MVARLWRRRVDVVHRRWRAVVVLIGGDGRSGRPADCPAYNRPVAPSDLVAEEGAESAADRAADGGVQALIIG